MARGRRVVSAVVGLVFLAGMVLINEVAFRMWFDIHYLRWYLDNGALISIVFGFVTLAWGDLNKMTYLISAHPMEYLAESVALMVLPLQAMAAIFEPGRQRWRASLEPKRSVSELKRALHQLAITTATPPPPSPPSPPSTGREVAPTGVFVIDFVFSLLFPLAFILTFIAWLLIVAPLQYFVCLVTGAPAREACASPARAWYRITLHGIHLEEAWKSDAVPEGATESGFSARPVTFTAAVSAAALFVASKLIG